MRYEVKIASRGKVKVSIQTVYAGISRYWAWLYPAGDTGTPRIVFQGASDDDLPDELSLPEPAQLMDRLCVVEALTASAMNAQTKVGVRIDVTQAGRPIFEDGLLEEAAVGSAEAVRFSFFLRFKRG